jgi:hypothetical protein
VQGEPPEAIPHIPSPKSSNKNHHPASEMAAEKFSFSFKTLDGTPLRLFGATAKTTTADLKNCLPTNNEPPNKELLPRDSTNPHTEVTKQANLVQESLHVIYTKAKANKVNKTHIEVSLLKEIGTKINTIIEYLELNTPASTPAAPSPSEPNNAILKAINELQTGMKRLEENYLAISAPIAKTTSSVKTSPVKTSLAKSYASITKATLPTILNPSPPSQ